MKKVTVIIPTYKRSESLCRAINSVLNQTYENLEIIVVDDNDKDSEYRKINEQKLEKYNKLKNFKYIRHDKNKNGAAARNTGIVAAEGEYIAFLDDDDYFFPDRIEKCVNILENNKKYGGVYTSVALKQGSKIINVINSKLSGNLALNFLKQEPLLGTGSNIFIKKEIIDKIGFFDEKFLRHQDIEYMVRFFNYSEIIALNQVLVVKSTDDKSNKLNYKKQKDTKDMFFKKFSKLILSYDKETQNEIYYANYRELLFKTFENTEEYKECVNLIKKYGQYGYKLKIIYMIKKLLYQKTFLKRLVDFGRSMKFNKLRKESIIPLEKKLQEMEENNEKENF